MRMPFGGEAWLLTGYAEIMRLAVPGDEVPWEPGLIARCPAHLPVTW
ncbi:hypothetical protein [Archangium sp. Cb G35]|nr:hypothetical protein [Archangium sp. Cb G35]